MSLVCVICSELLTDDVYTTSCGHIFHLHCLKEWLKRSKTCPQCRKRTTNRMIRKIYLNFSDDDTIVEDTSSLQTKIDNLTVQLNLMKNDVNHLTKTRAELENRTVCLQIKLKQMIFMKNCMMDRFEPAIKRTRLLNLENEQLKKKVEGLKKEVTSYLDEKRTLKDTFKNLKQKLMQYYNFSSEEHTKQKELKEQLTACEIIVEKLQSQAQLLECVSDKVPAEKQSNSKMIENESMKLDNTPELDKNDRINDVIRTPRDKWMVCRSFMPDDSFTVEDLRTKRTSNDSEISSTPAKKPRFNSKIFNPPTSIKSCAIM